MADSTYEVILGRVKQGDIYHVGDRLEMDESTAAPLVKARVLRLVPDVPKASSSKSSSSKGTDAKAVKGKVSEE